VSTIYCPVKATDCGLDDCTNGVAYAICSGGTFAICSCDLPEGGVYEAVPACSVPGPVGDEDDAAVESGGDGDL
jgi:hypothetical protein